jgi:hypothetical protein
MEWLQVTLSLLNMLIAVAAVVTEQRCRWHHRFPGPTGNRFEYNSMHGNGSVSGASFPSADARDLHAYVTGTFQNVWTGNECDTDLPTGTICGDE